MNNGVLVYLIGIGLPVGGIALCTVGALLFKVHRAFFALCVLGSAMLAFFCNGLAGGAAAEPGLDGPPQWLPRYAVGPLMFAGLLAASYGQSRLLRDLPWRRQK